VVVRVVEVVVSRDINIVAVVALTVAAGPHSSCCREGITCL
jgi:hypothetical protein